MKTAIVIPARFASSRLPAKPLLRETGKYLVQHVVERAVESGLGDVIVATDDARIADAVASFGGVARMTREDHASGTDRIAEVAESLDADIVVNLQGDEPTMELETLRMLPRLLAADASCEIATLATPIRTLELFQNPNCVKVVRDQKGRAMYFSRSPIPHWRDGSPALGTDVVLQHLGLYAFRRQTLLRLSKLPPSTLEMTEKLEQLRWLEAGYKISVGVAAHAARGVDTPEDYRHFVEQWNSVHARAA